MAWELDCMGLTTQFVGGMIGSALGDAVGELAFRYPDKEGLLAEINQLDILNYTDDTAMALALAESLVVVGDIDSTHLGDRFREHFAREPWRGYGPGPPTVFALVADRGISYEEAAQQLYGGAGSLGNGAAMRIAPLALYFYNSGALYEKVHASAVPTHAHPLGVDGAAVQARAIAAVMSRAVEQEIDPGSFVQELITFARTREMRHKLEQVRVLLEDDHRPVTAARSLGLSVAVHESMPFALYCFLRYPHDYQECLHCAILNGGDRDTMGAMAGAISGAHLGIDAIPRLWRDKLENRAWIEQLARELLAARAS